MNFELNSKTIFSICVLVVISFFLIFSFPTIIESDNALHIAFGDLYRHSGITFSDFRWQTNSILSVYRSDIWYGYHLLLAVFIIGSDFILSVQLATFFLGITFLILLYLIFNKFNIKFPLFWTLMFMFSSASELYRIFDLRPHVVIFILSILLTYFLVWDKNKKYLFVICTLFTFVEISMVWIPLCFLFLNFISNEVVGLYKKHNFKEVFKVYALDLSVIASGLSLGVLMRPNPIAGIKLFFYQIVYLYYVKLSGVALPWGVELYKLKGYYAPSFMCAFVVFFLALFFYLIEQRFIKSESNKRLIRFSLASAALFLIILVFVSARASDFFILFTFLSAAMVYTECEDFVPFNIKNNFLAKSLIIISIVSIFYSALFTFSFFRIQNGQRIDQYKNAATFLEQNTLKNSIVAYQFFDEFPELFLWNKSNLYQGHSDPIFQYAYNPKVYTDFICSLTKLDKKKDFFSEYFYDGFKENKCPTDDTDLIQILKHNMQADYFFINSNRPFLLVRYFLRDKRTQLIYFDDSSMIFKIN